jgi:hypothetical protein
MKLVTGRAGDGRGQMRERQRRDRALTPLIRDRYPTMDSLQIDFDFSDKEQFSPAPQVIVLHPPARAYLIFACPYGDCDGEFNLAPAVDEMVNSGESRDQGQLRCSGRRSGSRESHSSCCLVLEYQLKMHRR